MRALVRMWLRVKSVIGYEACDLSHCCAVWFEPTMSEVAVHDLFCSSADGSDTIYSERQWCGCAQARAAASG